jgi:hypothetical protein
MAHLVDVVDLWKRNDFQHAGVQFPELSHTISDLSTTFRATTLDRDRHLHQLTRYSGPKHPSELVRLAGELRSHLRKVCHLRRINLSATGFSSPEIETYLVSRRSVHLV